MNSKSNKFEPLDSVTIFGALVAEYLILREKDPTTSVQVKVNFKGVLLLGVIQNEMFTVYIDDVIVTRLPIDGINRDCWQTIADKLNERTKETNKTGF